MNPYETFRLIDEYPDVAGFVFLGGQSEEEKEEGKARESFAARRERTRAARIGRLQRRWQRSPK